MDKGAYPSVYVVDSHASGPPVPPRLNQRRKRAGVAQTLLFLLVSVALCGLAIEACLIYRLHQRESGTSASSSKLIAGNGATETHSLVIRPSKPLAHLTGGRYVSHEKQIMAWSMDADPLLYEMEYKNGSLVIQKEGFYYVYSKVSFREAGVFHHAVELNTLRYYGKSIPLLFSRKYSAMSRPNSQMQSNSYLGGVFHFHKDDAVFVKVSDTSKVLRHQYFENIFGAYMI